MAKVYHLAARQAKKEEVGQAAYGGRRHPVRRRWNPSRCVPLQALAWVVGAMAFVPALCHRTCRSGRR